MAFLLAAASTLTASSAISAQEEEDAMRMRERPKMFVDYVRGPLKGKNSRFPSHRWL